MFEIIIYLFESYMQIDQSMEIDAQEITDELLEEGFQKNDISKALAWLDKLTSLHEQNPQSKALLAKATSHRVYSAIEQRRLTSDCQGFICYLDQADILNTHTREVVIDCAMSLDVDELTLHDLKWLILMVLFNDPNSEDAFLQLESMLLDFEDGLIH
jgi:Smg protein